MNTDDRQALNDPTVSCCGRDIADCDCTPYDVDTVTRAYLEMMVWTGHYYESELDDNPTPLDDHYDPDDLPDEIVAEARADCEDFANNLEEDGLLARVAQHWTAEQLGHDFALTRNRHGAGFWDRGHGDIGDVLTDRAHPYGEWSLTGDPTGIYAE